MAARAVLLAKLLAGEMPTDIEAAFTECRLSLFPTSPRDLTTDCSCPDWANPCKHIAATYYLLAEAFDDDPFLILAWRGRSCDDLLTALGARQETALTGRAAPVGWTAPHAALPALEDCLDTFYDHGPPLPPPAAAIPGLPPDTLLRELDDPGFEIAGRSLADLLRPAYEAMTSAARQRLEGSAGRTSG